jgi:transcription-repair coupling factor (superfamily II helicase)
MYEKTVYKPAVATMAAARPKGVVKPDGSFAVAKFGGEPLRDQALLNWCVELLDTVLGPVLQAVLAN